MVQSKVLESMVMNDGVSIAQASSQQPILLIFLRHFGCTFCREAMSDISKQRKALQAKGVKVVLVHMTENKIAEDYFERYNLEEVSHISDPSCEFYKAFGLLKGNFHQLFGLKSWIRGFEAGVVEGHWVGIQQLGDGFQMPGAFAIQDSQIVDAFVHKNASDRPDYWKLIQLCSIN